tara:strand:+ start:1000 stop:1353 length:354 start_codon:yes stop_codon:yes gene_type:complete
MEELMIDDKTSAGMPMTWRLAGMPEKTSARYFKVGDVIRHTPSNIDPHATDWGLGIVVEATGPIFEAFWLGDDNFRKSDARLSNSYVIQNVDPMLEVADRINRMRPERDFCEKTSGE